MCIDPRLLPSSSFLHAQQQPLSQLRAWEADQTELWIETCARTVNRLRAYIGVIAPPLHAIDREGYACTGQIVTCADHAVQAAPGR
eukprot:CAMPEP_0114563068 /NCGR_PEP_ID=MMETSP0114-20121206/12888_1 /TAXON_ID=31324 /ORGANISM="Goniomonas sp, Strain m" /LENGTH=85 /DNA_ID=CAMNT_0001748841 /DNA_START=94 /DNA_END=348 /DNA_ORIENTATION=+